MKCTYCGELRPSTMDHVIPQACKPGQSYDRDKVVPACHECNSTLGAVPLFTISQRAEFLAEKFSRKYRDLIKAPTWEPDEIAELEGRLRISIAALQHEKEMITKRLDHLEYVRLIAPSIKEIWSECEF